MYKYIYIYNAFYVQTEQY